MLKELQLNQQIHFRIIFFTIMKKIRGSFFSKKQWQSLGIILIITVQILTPCTARAELLHEVQKKYNSSICTQQTQDQTKVNCEAAKSALLAADMSVFTATLYGATAAVCAAACATAEPVTGKVCTGLEITTMVTDAAASIAVADDYAKALQSMIGSLGAILGMKGMMALMNYSTNKGAEKGAEKAVQKGAEESAEKGAQKTAQEGAEKGAEKAAEKGAEKTAQKGTQTAAEKSAVRMSACMSVLTSLLMVTMKGVTAAESVKLANEKIKLATETTGGNVVTIAASGATQGQSGSTAGNTGGQAVTSQPITPIDTTNPQSFSQAMSMATATDRSIPPGMASKPFSDAVTQVTGQGLGQFLANSKNDPVGSATAAASAGLGLSPTDSSTLSSIISDFSGKVAQAAPVGNVAQASYSGGGGGGAAGSGGDQDDPFNQMMANMMAQLNPQGQSQDGAQNTGGANVLVFAANKPENAGIHLDKTQNLFEKVSIRYLRIERRFFP